MTATALVLNLLFSVGPVYQEVEFINNLNNLFKFDHNIFLMDSSAHINRFVNTRRQVKFTPQSVYDIVGGVENLKGIKSKKTFMIVVSEDSNFENNLLLLTEIKKIQRLQKGMYIGMFFSDIVSKDDRQKFFAWFFNQRIVNVFLAFNLWLDGSSSRRQPSLNIFNFNPFGTFGVLNVINVTGSESFDNIFLSQNSNFQQYPIRVTSPILFPTSTDNIYKRMWYSVARIMNASIVYPLHGALENADIRRRFLRNGTMDINPAVQKIVMLEDATFPVILYPLYMESTVILVPEALPYPEFSSFLKSLTGNFIFVFLLLTIVAIVLLLTYIRYIKQKKNLIFQSVSDVLNLLMYDNGTINYCRLSHIEVLLIVPLTFVGFIIVNATLSTLLSYLTRPIMQPQMNTIQELYNYPVNILVVQPDLATLTKNVLQNISKYDWSEKTRLSTGMTGIQQMRAYNTAIPILSDLEIAKGRMIAQKLLDYKGYHIIDVYISTNFYAYEVSDDYPFIERLNEIIHRMHNAGLILKWRLTYDRFVKNFFWTFNVMQDRGIINIDNTTEVDRFPIPMIIFYLWFASIILFGIEVNWEKLKKIEFRVIIRQKILNWRNGRLKICKRFKK